MPRTDAIMRGVTTPPVVRACSVIKRCRSRSVRRARASAAFTRRPTLAPIAAVSRAIVSQKSTALSAGRGFDAGRRSICAAVHLDVGGSGESVFSFSSASVRDFFARGTSIDVDSSEESVRIET